MSLWDKRGKTNKAQLLRKSWSSGQKGLS